MPRTPWGLFRKHYEKSENTKNLCGVPLGARPWTLRAALGASSGVCIGLCNWGRHGLFVGCMVVVMTPECPKGLIEFACEIEGVDLVCFLEYCPAEIGSKDSFGLAYEPDQDEGMDLVNAYITGTNVDIAHLLMQSLVDHITITALDQSK